MTAYVLTFIALSCAAPTLSQTDCPTLAAQFTPSDALNLSGFSVYLDPTDEELQEVLAVEVPLVANGVESEVAGSLERLQALSSLLPSLPANVSTLPVHLQLSASSSHKVHYVVSVWSLDDSLALSGCPSPRDGGCLDPGEEEILRIDLPCKASGDVYLQACLTVGTEPFSLLNGTYHTFSLFFLRTCGGTSENSCDIAPSMVPGEFCMTVNQVQELISYPEGQWSLIFVAFGIEDFRDATEGFCVVGTFSGGVVPIVTDPNVNPNFPIAEVFPDLEMYIGKATGTTSPVVYSIAFDVEDEKVMGQPHLNITNQGILEQERKYVTVYLPCLSPGFTRVFMHFNVSSLTEGTLYREDYSFYFHRNCTPANATSSSAVDDNLDVKVGVPVAVIGSALLLAGALIVVMVLLTHRQRRKTAELRQQIELQQLSISNAYLAAHFKDPFEFLEEHDVEYNYASLEVVEELGEGCFGRVFKAQAPGIQRGDHTPPEFVAVKTLKDDTQSGMLDSFCKEVKTSLQFDHKNIIRLLGVCTKTHQKCMIFEYMDLGSLNDLLRQSDPRNPSHSGTDPETVLITPDLFFHCAMQVAEGLAYLASLRFVHRDIASRNCLVNRGLEIKIADFGMSREVNHLDYYRIGSAKAYLPVRWMPPEALLYGKFTVKSDVWSYGVVVWEVYTFGRQPYAGASNHEVIDRVKEGRVLECPELCPAAVYDIMKSCWTRAPSKRPDTREVLNRLYHLARSTSMTQRGYVGMGPAANGGYQNLAFGTVAGEQEVEEGRRVAGLLQEKEEVVANLDSNLSGD